MNEAPVARYLQVAQRQAWVLVLIPLVVIATTAVVTSRQPSMYRTDMKMFVGQGGGGLQPVIGSRSLTQTMINLLQSDIVARTAIARLKLDAKTTTVDKRMHVHVKPDSSVIDVSLDWPDTREGPALLGQIANSFIELVRKKLGLSSSTSTFDAPSANVRFFATVVDPPHLEPGRVAPTPAKNLGFAAALGIALGLVFAFVRDGLDDRIQGRRAAEAAFGAPVIGVLPKEAHVHPLAGRNGDAANANGTHEAVRLLLANIRFTKSGEGGGAGPAILVTSAREHDGRSTATACLALALAQSGMRVVCVDANMRQPGLHEFLGVPADGPGLVEVLAGRVEAVKALRSVGLTGRAGTTTNGANAAASNATTGSLQLLSAGGKASPVAALDSTSVRKLIKAFKPVADYVIFDSPPLLTSGDAFPLALETDSVIVVARNKRTTRSRAEAVRETLTGLGVKHVSVVLTHARGHQPYGERST